MRNDGWRLGLAAVFVLSCNQKPGEASLLPPATPPALKAPEGQKVVLKAAAKGVQIYTCSPKPADAFEWTLKAPEADLFDGQGQKIGNHYGGPTWESTDGSKAVGQLKEKADAPEAGAIPWLLLDVKSNEGKGVLGKVKSVQRVDTKGGKAPSGGCDAGHSGAEVRVDYQATYYFYENGS